MTGIDLTPPDGRRFAIVLLERPAIGPGAARERGKLPDVVCTEAYVDDVRMRCEIERALVAELAGTQRAPTWGLLQRVWPTVAALLRAKIRARRGDPAGASGEVVRLAPDDLARFGTLAGVPETTTSQDRLR